MANGAIRTDSPHPGGMPAQQPGAPQHRLSHLGPGQQQQQPPQQPQQRPPGGGGLPAGIAPGVVPGRTGSPGTLGQVRDCRCAQMDFALVAALLRIIPAIGGCLRLRG